MVRVRFAPSPTGFLHVGGARSALYNYVYAKRHGGQFLLRIEDTDQERSTEESLRMQIADLKWLGLDWDEGPDAEDLTDQGELGPYRQSQRLSIYGDYAMRLVAQGRAYYCFLTDEEIDSQREKAKAAGKPLQINSPFRDIGLDEAEKRLKEGQSATIRFKIPDDREEYQINDLIRGEVKWHRDMVSDFVIMRSGGMPVYNFCCAIDDALMKITHVFRAEEHLNNSIRQMMIYEALGFEPPQFGHMSLILGEDKQKLSKRHGATSVHDYSKKGILPEALINYLALLGWSHPQEKEIFSLGEMVNEFSAERLKAAPAVFDEKKLRWVNSCYIKQLSPADLWSKVAPLLSDLPIPEDQEWRLQTIANFQERLETLDDVVELYRPLVEFGVDESSGECLSWPESKSVIQSWAENLRAHSEEFLTEASFGELQNAVKQHCGVKGKHLFMPIRVAVIGKPQGADLKLLVPMISREELVRRSEEVLQSL